MLYLTTLASKTLELLRRIQSQEAFSGIRGAFAAGMKPVLIPDQAEPTEEIRTIASVYPDLKAAISALCAD